MLSLSFWTTDTFLSFASPVFYSPYCLIYTNCCSVGSALMILPRSCLQMVVLITKGLKRHTLFWGKLRTLFYTVDIKNLHRFSFLGYSLFYLWPNCVAPFLIPTIVWGFFPTVFAYCVLSLHIVCILCSSLWVTATFPQDSAELEVC